MTLDSGQKALRRPQSRCEHPAMSDTPPPRLTEGAARALLDALPGITWRPFERDDLPEIAAFFTEVETFDANPERTSLVGLQEFWDAERSVPEEDTLAGYDEDGRVVAVGWSGCNRAVTEERRVYLGGAVRPDRRGEGIGRAVLGWEVAHARSWDVATREPGHGPLVMRLYAPTGQADVRDLADRHGLTVARHFYEMVRPLGPVEVPALDGIRIVEWEPARSAEAHAVLNAAFRDHWGRVDTTPEMWQEGLDAEAFRPQWSLLAIDEATDAVVAVALGCAYEQDWSEGHRQGYTDELGVLREYRGRGIARAMLLESMRRFAADGMDEASLGVDTHNESGALRLYESLGYVVEASTCVHELVEGP